MCVWGGGGGYGCIKIVLFLHTTKFHFLSDVQSNVSTLSCCTGLRAESHFLRCRQLEVGGVTLYDKG